MYFIRREGDFDGETRPTAQIFCVPLEKLTADPDEPGERSDGATGEGTGAPEGRRPMMGRAVTPKTPKIDWAGLKRRTRQVTRGGSVFTYILPGSERRPVLRFAGTEGGAAGGGGPGGLRGGGGGGGTPSIYTIQDNGKRQTRVASGTPRPTITEGDTPPPRGLRGGGFRGGMSKLRLTKDGRSLFFQEGDSVYSTPISGGGGGGGGFEAPCDGCGGTRAVVVAAGVGARVVRPPVPVVVVAGPAAQDLLRRHRPDR